jgi:hypothetical protein
MKVRQRRKPHLYKYSNRWYWSIRHFRIDINFAIGWKRLFLLFISFAVFGTLGEIVVGYGWLFVFGRVLWVYYNGFFTSVPSFLMFGIFGLFGLFLVHFLLKRHNKEVGDYSVLFRMRSGIIEVPPDFPEHLLETLTNSFSGIEG